MSLEKQQEAQNTKNLIVDDKETKRFCQRGTLKVLKKKYANIAYPEKMNLNNNLNNYFSINKVSFIPLSISFHGTFLHTLCLTYINCCNEASI